MRSILLNPGPVTLSESVRAALTGPDLCHREPEFFALQDDIRSRLLGLYDLDPALWTAVLMTGSGTAAVEAMVSSVVPESGSLLVIENGVYGERISAMARAHGIRSQALSLEWGERIDPSRLAAELAAARPSHVAVVHHETTTGRLNDLGSVATLCREHGARLLIDGVSSFGAEAIDFEDTVAACAATANKCLHGTPGAAFAVVSRDALPPIDAPRRSLYLDLGAYARAQDAGGTPFTQSVQSFYALAAALRELEAEGGVAARRKRYAGLAAQVEAGFAKLGVSARLSAAESSVVLRSYDLPAGVGYEALHDGLKARGFVIYAGQGALASSVFRISTMGAIGPADVERLVAGVGEVLATARVEEG